MRPTPPTDQPCPWCVLADLLALFTAYAPPPVTRTLPQEGEP